MIETLSRFDAAQGGLEFNMDRVASLCEEHGLRFPPLEAMTP